VAAAAEPDRAHAYDAWYATGLGAAAHRSELDLVAELAAPAPGERALDVGCGTGVYTAWLAGHGLDVTGLDRDPAMLAAAHAKAPAARLLEGDATALPFADADFDLAVAVTLFCFLDAAQRLAAARELVRVVRPGGRVVVGELARYSLWAARRRLEGWRGSATWRRAHFSTAGELRRLLADAGATGVRTAYALYLPPWDTPRLLAQAETIERLGRPLRALGAGFVAARADVGGERAAPPTSLR
jgi:ubiquinone/menaquinone biosynthesis C-methylase UbiE